MKSDLFLFIFLLSVSVVGNSYSNQGVTLVNQTNLHQKHADSFPLGTYQHYKGDFYEVLGVGRHSETNEELVFYRCKYYTKEFGNNALWVRPFTMFTESVNVNGSMVPRFRFIG